MSSECMITGKCTAVGNNVAHCNKKTRRQFKANLHWKRFFVPNENRYVRLRVSQKGMRMIDKLGIESILETLRARGVKF